MGRGASRAGSLGTAIILMGAALLFWQSAAFAGTPTLGADCGAGATMVGSDFAGKVTMGTSLGSCTLTFSAPYANAPACAATDESRTRPVDATSTTTTLMIGQGVNVKSNDVVSYLCVSY